MPTDASPSRHAPTRSRAWFRRWPEGASPIAPVADRRSRVSRSAFDPARRQSRSTAAWVARINERDETWTISACGPFEESLWTADPQHYAECIDDECLMVLPKPPFVMSGKQAIDAVSATPRWSSVELSERQVARPQEGLIVVAYQAHAKMDGGEDYQAHCTSTYRRLAHESGAWFSTSRRRLW